MKWCLRFQTAFTLLLLSLISVNSLHLAVAGTSNRHLHAVPDCDERAAPQRPWYHRIRMPRISWPRIRLPSITIPTWLEGPLRSYNEGAEILTYGKYAPLARRFGFSPSYIDKVRPVEGGSARAFFDRLIAETATGESTLLLRVSFIPLIKVPRELFNYKAFFDEMQEHLENISLNLFSMNPNDISATSIAIVHIDVSRLHELLSFNEVTQVEFFGGEQQATIEALNKIDEDVLFKLNQSAFELLVPAIISGADIDREVVLTLNIAQRVPIAYIRSHLRNTRVRFLSSSDALDDASDGRVLSLTKESRTQEWRTVRVVGRPRDILDLLQKEDKIAFASDADYQ